MHEELDRPTTDAKTAPCECACTAAGEDDEGGKMSNLLAVRNDIGG